MNQSIFSMIAAAGSRTDFNARFDESSESEDEGDQARGRSVVTEAEDEPSSVRSRLGTSVGSTATDPASTEEKQKRKRSEHKILHTLPGLPLRAKKDNSIRSGGTGSLRSGTAIKDSKQLTPRDAPMMSRLLTAQAELDSSEVSVDGIARPDHTGITRVRTESSPASLLAIRLMEIFGFNKPERVVSEYPCWLLQSVLLQGYMYITEHHICFYAYLPKKSNVVAKTGYLSKRGRQNPKYHRYWFILKGDVLSYYSNPSELYFPSGNIDLRYGISAALAGEKAKKDVKDFSVTTNNRSYHFRADSAPSAREWVKTLQKVIFRSHNDGDSVKISLPLENVIDIEESPVVEFAETFKVRVIESGESYAIDEVCSIHCHFRVDF